MADGSHLQRVAPKRVRWHVASVATLVLIVLFFQDSLPGTPWPGKQAPENLRFRYLRSWWQGPQGEEVDNVTQAVAKGRELMRGRSPERAYHAYVSVQTEEAQLGSTEPKNHMAWLTDSQKARPIIPKPLRTLRFKLCNEFADQRLALMYGVLLANVTGRIPVLPELLLKGEQYNNDDNQSSAAEATVPMSEVYDVDRFLEGVSRRAGVRILRPTEAPEFPDYVPFSIAGDWQDWLDKLTQVEAPHVALNCTLLKLGKDAIREKEGLAWAVLDSLKLNERLAGIRDAAVARSAGRKSAGSHVKQRLQRGPAVASFNFLHLPIDNDWLAYCKRLEGLRDGVPRVNCLSNTWNIHEALRIKGIDPAVPLYVSAHWENVTPKKGAHVLARLKEAGYQVLRKADVFNGVDLEGLSRQQGAALEFYLALEADKFIGNSVSTFTALLLAERAHASKWASYYNGQNVPLSSVLPFYKLPWMFTYNSWSEKYDYMMKAAVRSAIQVGGVMPYCMFAGDEASAVYRFLLESGVQIIKHDPLWANDLARLASKPYENMTQGHVYADTRRVVGTFLRIDIPILAELTQYDYLLFTDVDVFFRRRLDLDSFPAPLPAVLFMATENDGSFPYNAGVMLMNLPGLRTTYDAFMKFIRSNERGLHFGLYGPFDQGAYNQFYETDIRTWKLPQVFNARPFHEGDPDAFIVHFQGPKPQHYARYLTTGRCPFPRIPRLCELAVKNGYCDYIEDWAEHYKVGDSLDFDLPPKCSLELRLIRKLGQEVPWGK